MAFSVNGMQQERLSLYVHLPFCRTLCTYCAFNTYAGMLALVEPYVAALEREMALVGQAAGGQVGRLLSGIEPANQRAERPRKVWNT